MTFKISYSYKISHNISDILCLSPDVSRRGLLNVLPSVRPSGHTNGHILGSHLVGTLHRVCFSPSLIPNKKEGLVGYF